MSANSGSGSWRTFAVIAALIVGAVWWWNNQSSVAELKAGTYDCVAVYVNAAGKYEVYVDAAGREFGGYARVVSGSVTSYSAPNALGWRSGAPLTLKKSGTTHFNATQDPATHSYDALACDWSEA